MRKTILAVALACATLFVSAPAEAGTGRWAVTSVGVYIDPTIAHEWRTDSVLAAWSAGPISLYRASVPCETCINVTVGKTVTEVGSGEAVEWAFPDGTIAKCEIVLTPTPSYVKTQIRKRRSHVLAHEIGHCLGLTHNNKRNSVMSESTPLTFAEIPLPRPNDIAALNSRYI